MKCHYQFFDYDVELISIAGLYQKLSCQLRYFDLNILKIPIGFCFFSLIFFFLKGNYLLFFSNFINSMQKISGESVGEVKVVTDMHERKAEMARQCDAFIALPGNFISFVSFLVFLQ